MSKKANSTFDLGSQFTLLRQVLTPKFAFIDTDLDDTNVVLLATSMIDKMLQLILLLKLFKHAPTKTSFEAVFEGNGPLSTFAAKITLIIAFGLATEDTQHDLKVLKKIRNDFAHLPKRLFLEDMPSCLNLKGGLTAPLEIVPKERQRFVEASRSIIGELSIFGTLVMAEITVINDHRQDVAAKTEELLDWFYSGAATPRPSWLPE